ncbi:MAG: C40 family peptidase [Bacteroidales bacterium]|nr:C40 family peptidase [Bacteroidales bacterium]
MKYAVCSLNIVPVRSDPSEKAEMSSQWLFGELAEVISEFRDWLEIKMQDDSYTGWIDRKQATIISPAQFDELKHLPAMITIDPVSTVLNAYNRYYTYLPAGSILRNTTDHSFEFPDEKLTCTGAIKPLKSKAKTEEVVERSFGFLNAGYLWGGKTVFGMDCSGYMQALFKTAGIMLKRDASEQVKQGEAINLVEEARAGDLLFFDNPEGKIVHIGMHIGHNKIIHASGKVRIDFIDHQGIYNRQLKKYTHNLRVIKRIV